MYELWYFFNKELKTNVHYAKKPMSNKKSNKLTFEDIIFNLQNFVKKRLYYFRAPPDIEVGAGLFIPHIIKKLGEKWKCAYVQQCRRPTDGRYGEKL